MPLLESPEFQALQMAYAFSAAASPFTSRSYTISTANMAMMATWTATATTNSSSLTQSWVVSSATSGGTSIQNFSTSLNSVQLTMTTPGYTFATTGNHTGVLSSFDVYIPREKTPEEKAALALAEQQRQEREKIRTAARFVAKGKATTLLKRFLSREQLRDYEEYGFFYVWGQDGFKYRIKQGWSHNVHRVNPETNQPTKTFCIHPKTWTPDEDNMLAQKLLLEADPDTFFKTAYSSRP